MPHYVDISPKIKAWTRFVAFDEGAKAQVNNLASLDIVHKHVAIMPDVHLGKGATVGSVIPTKNAIIPSAVGVDIGCGMMAVRTTLAAHHLPDDLSRLRHAIEKAIPVGFGKWADNTLPDIALKTWQTKLRKEYQMILNRHPALGFNRKTGRRQINDVNHLGTLGGGNHFIEICLDDAQQVWLMLHSGSRGVGNCIGTYFIELAKTEMGRLLGTLPDEDLAYLSEGTQHFEDYFIAVNWAQAYARCNRDIMMQILTQVLTAQLQKPIATDLYAVNCHHNYVSKERHFNENLYITRKGAVSAKKDELGIIPGSMGAKSFIVRDLAMRKAIAVAVMGRAG